MMSTGVSAMMVEAIPDSVYCTAIRDSETPRNGPKIVARVIKLNPFLLWKALRRRWVCFVRSIIRKKPANPAIARIMVEEKGRM